MLSKNGDDNLLLLKPIFDLYLGETRLLSLGFLITNNRGQAPQNRFERLEVFAQRLSPKSWHHCGSERCNQAQYV